MFLVEGKSYAKNGRWDFGLCKIECRKVLKKKAEESVERFMGEVEGDV